MPISAPSVAYRLLPETKKSVPLLYTSPSEGMHVSYLSSWARMAAIVQGENEVWYSKGLSIAIVVTAIVLFSCFGPCLDFFRVIGCVVLGFLQQHDTTTFLNTTLTFHRRV